MRTSSIWLLLVVGCGAIGCAKPAPTTTAPVASMAIAPVAAAGWHAPLAPPSQEASASGETAAAGASEDEAASPTPPQAFASCKLKATLRDAGASPTGRFMLTVTNTGSKPIRLVVPGDGSEAGWRTPTLTWTATVGGTPVAPSSQARCGMMNRIDASEIFTLAPGASRDLKEWVSDPSFAKGTYDLRLTYRNDPGLAARSRGGESADVKRDLAASTACEATSNTLHVSL